MDASSSIIGTGPDLGMPRSSLSPPLPLRESLALPWPPRRHSDGAALWFRRARALLEHPLPLPTALLPERDGAGDPVPPPAPAPAPPASAGAASGSARLSSTSWMWV